MSGQATGQTSAPNFILRRARFNAGLSQEQLASQVGLSRAAISDMERDASVRPNPSSAKAIADVLGGKATDFFSVGDGVGPGFSDAA